jgi:hypothetical protein
MAGIKFCFRSDSASNSRIGPVRGDPSGRPRPRPKSPSPEVALRRATPTLVDIARTADQIGSVTPCQVADRNAEVCEGFGVLVPQSGDCGDCGFHEPCAPRVKPDGRSRGLDGKPAHNKALVRKIAQFQEPMPSKKTACSIDGTNVLAVRIPHVERRIVKICGINEFRFRKT